MGLLNLFTKKASGAQVLFNKNIGSVINALRKHQVMVCQKKGMTRREMAKELVYIEKRTKEFYKITLSEMKTGKNYGEIMDILIHSYAMTDTDRSIISKMFIR